MMARRSTRSDPPGSSQTDARRSLRSSLAGLLPALISGCVLAAQIHAEPRRPVDARLLQVTGFDVAAQWVVGDSDAWRDAWLRLTSPRRPSPPLPEVDFSKDIVVVVAMGRQRSGGYSVRIRSVEPHASGATVHAVVQEPGRGCVTTSGITAPADVVVLTKAHLPVAFDIRHESVDCS